MYKLFVASLWVVILSILFPVWPLELVVSFLVYIIVVAVVVIAVLMRRNWRRKPSIAYALLPLGILMILPVQSWTANTNLAESDDSITLYTHNMLYSVSNAPQVSELALEAGADIVALQEALPSEIEEVRNGLKFRDSYRSDCQDCSVKEDELALVTRYPILDAETVDVDVRGGKIISVLLNAEGTRLRVFAVHLPIPVLPSTYATRERGFARLTELVAKSSEPVIIMGDFNTTQWSPTMREFSRDNPTLVNTVQDGSSANSWCDRFFRLACLRIDHVFVDTRLSIISSEVGETAGSDHRAVITEIAR